MVADHSPVCAPHVRVCVHSVRARAPLSEIVMAVPKKRQSKMKTRQRKANVRRSAPHPCCPMCP